jgi:hypothetical protein
MNRYLRSGWSARVLTVLIPGASLCPMLFGQGSVQYGVFYMCPQGNRLKVFSCSGNEPGSTCDMQLFPGGQPGRRGPVSRGKVMPLIQQCHVQTAAEAQAAPSGAAYPGSGVASSNGIKVGDQVEVITGFGWTPAKVLAIQGNNYRVLANGVEVTKTYPNELRRLGGATASDHAAGQYRLGDRVQVNINGQWLEGKIITEMGMDYQVQFGNRTVWAQPRNLRPSNVPAPAAAKTGGPPRPGMVSCAGKFEGRYSGSGQGTITLTFRSGKATMSDMIGGEQVLECWTAGDKMILREPGKPDNVMSIDVNNDGTLQTPIWGELKKKGN